MKKILVIVGAILTLQSCENASSVPAKAAEPTKVTKVDAECKKVDIVLVNGEKFSCESDKNLTALQGKTQLERVTVYRWIHPTAVAKWIVDNQYPNSTLDTILIVPSPTTITLEKLEYRQGFISAIYK